MKNQISILKVFLLISFGIFTQCKKEEKPLTVQDQDGNIYSTVQINGRLWMNKNLKTTKLNDGTPLTNLETPTNWVNSIDAGYCWYNNDAAANKEVYGALYNYKSISTGKICPSGWHVPNDDDWISLISSLGGDSIATLKLKSSGSSNWSNKATNETGFSAEAGGFRWVSFASLTYLGYWWSSSSTSNLNHSLEMSWKSKVTAYGYGYGFSIRCIKD